MLTGYYFTQASLSSHLANASAMNIKLRDSLRSSEMMPEGADPARWKFDRESGVNGMEEMHDKYQSTRGDH